MTPSWILQTRTRFQRWRSDGPGVVVAVSGGSDSVGLLRVLHHLGPELGRNLSVAHLDHGVRGEAAHEDARFVAELAERLGLPIDVGHWSPNRSGHFEADARRARYAWLVEVARTRNASAVAVGHTRDDQAETILHRILRGTGPRGLAGMPTRRRLAEGIVLVRPLLNVSRAEIREYLAALGQDFREDASNADRSRTRAGIRHDLLPKLAEEYNPRVAEALVRLGRLAGASHRGWERRLARMVRLATLEAGPDQIVLAGWSLAPLPALLRAEALRMAWRRAGWPEAHMDEGRWHRLAILLERRQPARFSLGGGVEVWYSGGILCLAPTRPRPNPSPRISFPVPGSVIWGDGQIVATDDPSAAREETIDRDCLNPWVSTNGISFLWVKPPGDGDRFEPLGMDGHTMPLNDFLRGRGIRQEDRATVPVVCDKSGIIWVVGHRIAHRVRRTESTRRLLGLGLIKRPSQEKID